MGDTSNEQIFDEYWAHSENNSGQGIPERLADHLRLTAKYASEFGKAFGAERQCYMMGLLHDLGKYASQFQRRVRGIGREKGKDHSTQGAVALLKFYLDSGTAAALAILAHHIDLQQTSFNREKLVKDLCLGMQDKADNFTGINIVAMIKALQADGLTPDSKGLDGILLPNSQYAASMLDVRMLFSALVDADYLATEAHFDGDAQTPLRHRQRGPALQVDKALDALEKYLADLASENAHKSSSEIAVIRNQLANDCRAASQWDKGLFTLSAPTGSGKTLSMLLFALLHAKKHNLRRIVLVMPFLNIIDQTASIYRDLFGSGPGKDFPANYVLEDHSRAHRYDTDKNTPYNPDSERDKHATRLLSENWDAPIILTTNVTSLQSLMSNRRRACRKLHRLANSVILFDEAQTLPQELAPATLATLSRLSDRFGSTIVMATATQPAFDNFHEHIKPHCQHGWKPREIVQDTASLFKPASKRVKIHWRHREDISPEQLAAELAQLPQDQWLCIVNLKRHAKALIKQLQNLEVEGLLHLSTNMCTHHRQQCLKEINQRLKDSQPCRLIATQCVEAGVDLDFPVVYRALAPLESIAQAAGRCNRHGAKGPRGTVEIVNLKDDGYIQYPPGYGPAINSTDTFLQYLAANSDCPLDDMEIINSPQLLRQYFRRHYKLSGTGEGHLGKEKILNDAMIGLNFPKVAENYKLIDNAGVNVLTRCDEKVFDRLKSQLPQESGQMPDGHGFWRKWFAQAQPYSVSLYLKDDNQAYLEPIYLSATNQSAQTQTNWYLQSSQIKYDDLLGLEFPDQAAGWMA